MWSAPEAADWAWVAEAAGGCSRGRTEAECTTAELQARVAVRQTVREASAEGIEHQLQLRVLSDAGLVDVVALAAADWEASAARRDRWGPWAFGRPSKSPAAV
ncbi:hypothetical protein [Streptomyces sp. NPDC005408]|uniref:hypothetical protein n=1 Tax=Streptomyces sp. NPDC005408 TaxID=3155341 RepID=UPI0033BD5992